MSIAEMRCKHSPLVASTTEHTAYRKPFPELRGEALARSTAANY